MAFVCPECMTRGSLHVHSWIELPPDAHSDEITFQIAECSHCSFRAVALAEESRRGALASETGRHIGYRVRKDDWECWRDAIERCPDRSNKNCKCRAHKLLPQALA